MKKPIIAHVQDRNYAEDFKRSGSLFWQTEIFFPKPYGFVLALKDGKVHGGWKCASLTEFREQKTILYDGTKSEIGNQCKKEFSEEFAEECAKFLASYQSLEQAKNAIEMTIASS